MENSRFDDLIRTLAGSRRSLVSGTLALSLGLIGASDIDAKKKRKHKRKNKKKVKPATPNEFGCFEVDDPCTSAEQCCSGICDDKKCRAHDIGTCAQDRPGYCAEGNPELAACNGGEGFCFRSTAGSNVCFNRVECAECQRDADCEALGLPVGTACAPIGGDFACDGLCEETGMACVFFSMAETAEVKR